MTDEQGRHAAPGSDEPTRPKDPRPGAAPPDSPPQEPSPVGSSGDEQEWSRPADAPGGFAPRQQPVAYTPPPPTVSPAEQAVFGRPADTGAFSPAPGERLQPKHTVNPPVPRLFSDAFGTSADARDGFAPAAGTRLEPAARTPESPWWKSDAPRDPWRDPAAPFWLGRGAVFSAGSPAQIDPDQDVERADDPQPLEVEGEDEDLEPDEPKGRVRGGRFGLPALMVTLIVAVLAGAIGGFAGWFLTNTADDGLHRPDAKIAQAEPPAKRSPTSVAGIAKRVGPAVVSIAVKTKTEFAIGSGVVIDRDGDVLTNNHVISGAVEDKSATIVVTFSDEATAKARIVGHDPTSDLAVIKVPTDDLTVATLGKSSKLAVGDPVVAIGSPLGLQGTVTAGIVSALERPVHTSSENGGSGAYLSAIQTDAPINPGNSGGALVDGSGAVIGINTAAALGSTGPGGSGTAITGIGYAIPIDYARQIALQLIRTGTAVHGALGAQGRTVVSATPGKEVGGYLVQISPNGPAAKAGLKQGDVVVAADGRVIQTFDQLIVIVQQHQPGDHIAVTYYRKGSSTKSTTKVTLGKG